MIAVPVFIPLPAATNRDLGIRQWQVALTDWVRSGRPDLSNRQLVVLLTVVGDPAPHTVRGLANYLNVTKPVITRALNHLAELDYVRRIPDKADLRSIFIVTTALGQAFVEDLAADLQEHW